MSRQCKNPRGTIDYVGETNTKLEWLIDHLSTLFTKFDGQHLRTPVFEIRQILLEKYGQEAESKLLYHLESPKDNENKEEGQTESETLTLRYDHTIPLVRYLVQHKIQKGKFFRIGEVFRRDTPSKKQVRLRSFWQADFDFVGEYSPLEPEILLFCLINDFFEQITRNVIGKENLKYTILFNFRPNLFKIFELAQVEESKYAAIASAVDKLDKMTWEDVSKEMTQKGLSDQSIQKLKELLLDQEYLDPALKEAYDTLMKLNGFANPNQTLKFQPNLARGLDYYSGIIFEVLVDGIQGSVIAGGRYDGLVEAYKGGKGSKVPLLGLSFGLNRLLPLLTGFHLCPEKDFPKYKVYLAHIGNDLLEKKIKLYRDLVSLDLEVRQRIIEFNSDKYKNVPIEDKYYFETCFKKKKLAREINKCTQENFDLMIVLAPEEDEQGTYQIKIIKTSETYLVESEYLYNFLDLFQGSDDPAEFDSKSWIKKKPKKP